MTMGQRILQARLEAGLSQRELAGEEITRNMLSSLEHDAANPSVGTLRYLAQRLGKPVSWFLGEDGVSEGIAAFENGEYRRSRSLMTSGEKRWLEPLAILREAEQALQAGQIPYALQLLQELGEPESPLFGRELHRSAAILRCRCGEIADIPEDGGLLCKAAQALRSGRFADARRYLQAIDQREERWEESMGECCFQEGNYAQAKEHFLRCPESPRIISRLEVCFRELEDYKMAYHYAKKH